MMSPGKPDAAPKGGAERPQEQRTAAGDDKSKQHGAGPQGGSEHGGGYGPAGGYGMPPWWGMPPGMGGPYGMYGGMPPGGPQGAAQHHHHRPWDPPQPPNYAPLWPWSWMSWFMPWLGPWWSWLSSWFVFPGASWTAPPFSPFPLFPPAPWYPGGPAGSGADPTLRFAETRAAFYRHWFEAQAAIFQQAANASYVGYPPGYVPPPPAAQVDVAQLKEALKALPEPQAALVVHAVQMLQAWDGMRPQQRAGSDW